MDIDLIRGLVAQVLHHSLKVQQAAYHLEQALNAGTPEEVPRAGIVTGNIPVVKGSDMAGEGGEKVASLDIHDSILKGDQA